MVRTSGLIDREHETSELRAVASAARRRRGGLLLVAGEAGIGKTALVEHAIGRRIPIVLRGAARASLAAPFEPLAAALRSHPRWPAVAGDVLVASGASGPSLDALGSLFGELAQSRRGHATGAAATRSDDRGDPEAIKVIPSRRPR